MDIIQEIEAEVQHTADGMSIEILLMLVDKLERDFALKSLAGHVSMQDALSHYVGLKIALHHMTRRYDDDDWWMHAASQTVQDKIPLYNLTDKTKKARRDYYVAKRRVEGEHVAGCSCRGCRCLAEIPWDRANEACSSPN